VQRSDKERIVTELTARLRETESLIVADYRGLSNSELADLRTALLAHGARFSVVKNTLTRRAAEAAGADQLLALLEGPTAIAFVETDGDTVAVAKALADSAAQTKVLSVRGGMMAGKPISQEEIETLAKLPPLDVLKGQLVGVIAAPLTGLAALLAAPLRDLVGLIEARIAQLEQSPGPASEPAAETEQQPSEAELATEGSGVDEADAAAAEAAQPAVEEAEPAEEAEKKAEQEAEQEARPASPEAAEQWSAAADTDTVNAETDPKEEE
jgi:large subunit ribosomal protein L10